MDADAGAYDHRWALKYDECIIWFKNLAMNPFPERLSCNATWDGIMCWPAIAAGTKYQMKCPPEDGFDTNHTVTKHCHYSGKWAGKDKYDFSHQQGWTDYSPCYPRKDEEQQVDIVRLLWYIGLVLSIVAILVVLCLLIFGRARRRWRLNQARIGFLSSLLLVYIVRLTLHVDEEYSITGGSLIHEKPHLCEAIISLLEFLKLLSAGWLTCACFHGLFEVISERRAERALCIILYAVFAFVFALLGVIVWICILLLHDYESSRFACFGTYQFGTISAFVLVYGTLAILSIATVCALAHAVVPLFKSLVKKNSRFAGVRWLVQALIHTVICGCFLLVWYYDLWLKAQHDPDDEAWQHHSLIEAIIIGFFGFLAAVLIALAQYFLPAKEIMHF